MSPPCFICPLPGRFRCPQCSLVLFCGETHGEYHVMTDSPCHSFTWREDRLVASRSVSRGEIVLRERPAVVAPSGRLGETEAGHCLVCLARLDTQSCLLCEGCGFPLCDECEGAQSHQADCDQLAGWAATSYSPLLPHRLLQLRQSQPSLYHDLLSLGQSGKPRHHREKVEVKTFLQHQHQVSREEVEAVLAVLETHGVPLAPNLTGLYYLTSLLARRRDNNCELVTSQTRPHLLCLRATRQPNTQYRGEGRGPLATPSTHWHPLATLPQ